MQELLVPAECMCCAPLVEFDGTLTIRKQLVDAQW